MLKGRRKGMLLLIGAVLIVCVIAAVWAWQQRRDLAAQVIAGELAERGITPVSFDVSFIGLRSISLSDVVIGDPASPDARVGDVTVTYSLGELISGRVRSIDVGEAYGRIRFDEDGLSFGALDPLLQGGGEGGGMAVPPVEIEKAVLEIGTPQGDFMLAGPLSIRPDGDAFSVSTEGIEVREASSAPRIAPLLVAGEGKVSPDVLSFRAEVSSPATGDGVHLLHAEGQYDIAAHEGHAIAEGRAVFARDGLSVTALVPALEYSYLDLSGGVEYRGEAHFVSGDLAVSGEMKLDRLAIRQTAAGDMAFSGRLSFEGTRGEGRAPYRVDLKELAISDLSGPERFAPVLVEGPITMQGERIETALVVRSALPAIRGARLANIDADFNRSKGEGTVRAQGDLSFAPGKLELQTVLPVLKGIMTDMSGGLSYSAQARFTGGGLSTSGMATLSDVGLVAPAATVKGVSGTVQLSSLVPPATRGVQTLSVRTLEAGIPLENGKVAFEMDGQGLRLVGASWPFAQGKLLLTSAGTSVIADNAEFLLTVDEVDLGTLVEIVEVPGLRMTGHIGGSVPVVIRNGDPILLDGKLEALESGIIIYRGTASDVVSSEQTKLLTDALDNFHYTELRGGLSGNANGEVILQLALRGHNPDLYEGYPFAINVKLEGSLADVLRRGTVGFRPLELIREHDGSEATAP
jgi:hypothetical protein